ncbi:MAG: hypothetical protein OEM53_08060 [Nitrosopumilus sp.]|nr:hypothetical protein [Nitrosopumilus sp.]
MIIQRIDSSSSGALDVGAYLWLDSGCFTIWFVLYVKRERVKQLGELR